VTTRSNIVEIIQKNEQDEFLTYFPEFGEVFSDIQKHIDAFCERLEAALAEIRSAEYATRKDVAEAIMKKECPACLFSLIDGKEASARGWLMSRPAAKVLDYACQASSK
jgi:vacuolar-type H+-ATPase subunit I/STV1